jgi:hypothetical protein
VLTPEIGGAHFVVGSLLILAQEGAGKPNGTHHSVSLRGRADDRCWPNAAIEIFLNIRPLNEVKRT